MRLLLWVKAQGQRYAKVKMFGDSSSCGFCRHQRQRQHQHQQLFRVIKRWLIVSIVINCLLVIILHINHSFAHDIKVKIPFSAIDRCGILFPSSSRCHYHQNHQQRRRHDKSVRSKNILWGIRGGGDVGGEAKQQKQQHQSSYKAIGLQIVTSTNDDYDERISNTMEFLSGCPPFTIFVQDSTSSTTTTLQLKQSSSTKQQQQQVLQWKGDISAVESLTTVCDIMVIVIVLEDVNNTNKDVGDGTKTTTTISMSSSSSSSSSLSNNKQHRGTLLDPKFVQGLERGLQHRAMNNMTSSILILLATNTLHKNDSKPSQSSFSQEEEETSTIIDRRLTYQKEQLVLQELSNITPKLVSNLDLISLDDSQEGTVGLTKIWKEYGEQLQLPEQEERTTCHVLIEDAQIFPRLLHDIYQSKGGTNTHFLKSIEQQDLRAVSTYTMNDSIDNNNKNMKHDTTADTAPIFDMHDSDINNEISKQEESEIEDYDEALFAILQKSKYQIQDLEQTLEQLWFGFSSSGLDDDEEISSSNPAGSLDFGTTADQIVETYLISVQKINSNTDESGNNKAQQILREQVLVPLQQLYKQYLQFFREYYGKKYETVLLNENDNDDENKNGNKRQKSKEEYQAEWEEAASQITTSFREVAQAGVPTACRPGGIFRDANFDYIPSLEGLLSDMMQATEDQQELLGIYSDDDYGVDEVEEDDNEQGGRGLIGLWRRRQRRKRLRRLRSRPAKWYEKVAAKAFVFAINYLQGWLAYQGIKRAAAERDQHLPKFPLF